MDVNEINETHRVNMRKRNRELSNRPKAKAIDIRDVNKAMQNRPITDRRLYAHFAKRWQVLNGNKKHLSEKYNDNDWYNNPCYIIAGGPSVNQYDRKQFDHFLEDKKVIGINRAFQHFDNININIAADICLYKWIIETPGKGLNKKFWEQKEKGIDFCFVDLINNTMDDVYYINNIGREGLGASIKEGLFCCSNTGYAAINLAYCLGANPIFLIGYDMKFSDAGEHHYHNNKTGANYQKTLRGFNKVLPKLAGRFTEERRWVYNISKDTAVECFPYRKIWQHYKVDEYNFVYKGEFLSNEFAKDNPEYDRSMTCFVSKEELTKMGFDTIQELRDFNDKYIDDTRLFFLRRDN